MISSFRSWLDKSLEDRIQKKIFIPFALTNCHDASNGVNYQKKKSPGLSILARPITSHLVLFLQFTSHHRRRFKFQIRKCTRKKVVGEFRIVMLFTHSHFRHSGHKILMASDDFFFICGMFLYDFPFPQRLYYDFCWN